MAWEPYGNGRRWVGPVPSSSDEQGQRELYARPPLDEALRGPLADLLQEVSRSLPSTGVLPADKRKRLSREYAFVARSCLRQWGCKVEMDPGRIGENLLNAAIARVLWHRRRDDHREQHELPLPRNVQRRA